MEALTVAELIAALSKLDPAAHVCTWKDDEGNGVRVVYAAPDGVNDVEDVRDILDRSRISGPIVVV